MRVFRKQGKQIHRKQKHQRSRKSTYKIHIQKSLVIKSLVKQLIREIQGHHVKEDVHQSTVNKQVCDERPRFKKHLHYIPRQLQLIHDEIAGAVHVH